jgi:hypothetical protein
MNAADFPACLDRLADRRLTPIVEALRAPMRVAVLGRPGVGRRTVAAALTAAGCHVVDDGSLDSGELRVAVITEAVKPEDPAGDVVVCNKADLCPDAELPGVPMTALLAVATLDAELVDALRVLAADPADLSSCDAFTAAAHRLPAPLRARLLDTLDRYGIASAVLALRGGRVDHDAPAALTAHLRRISGLPRVLDAIDRAAALPRYRRIRDALTDLTVLAAQSGDDRLWAVLRADDTVRAVAVAGREVLHAAGEPVDVDSGTAAWDAVRWRRYARGPVDALHRDCALDIARHVLRATA